MTDEDPEDSGYKIHTLLLDMRVGTLGRATSGRGELFLADLPLPSFKGEGAGYESVHYGITNTRPTFANYTSQ